jgi:hypothetical protein
VLLEDDVASETNLDVVAANSCLLADLSIGCQLYMVLLMT